MSISINQFRKELLFISQMFFKILLWNSEAHLFKLLVKILLEEIFEVAN